MHRLFVAIRPPAAIISNILAIMSGIEGARWQNDAQLHITLRYIGEVDRHRAQDIAVALDHIAFAPFEIALSGVGNFQRKGRLDSLWTGITPVDHLEHLHRKIDRACIQCGLPPEGRAYLPHMTLARFGRIAGSADHFMAQHAGLISTPFMVRDFCLFESELGQGGSTYQLIERYRANEPGASL
ncbi:RNA 2',3'-cyclic phosphodiesterase [Sphingobium aromaticiconvertens]|uniref:RNA 2',3'-cyclic phosphodiesterase n=1 Tax=Sphingobium aromaticiconvertens TaxID=365341 RepID=UPI003019FF50